MEELAEELIVFGGPSLPDSPPKQSVVYRAPIRRGDLTTCSERQVIVILDGLFLQSAAATHYEYLTLLQKGAVLIGAASMGALRAVELRDFGLRGIGSAYRAFLSGVIVDDSELAVGICPLTHRALTVSLFDIRGGLAQIEARGVDSEQVRSAFMIAQNIQFWERTRSHLLAKWERSCPDVIANRSHFDTDQWNLKKVDATDAIELGLSLRSGRLALAKGLLDATEYPVSLYTPSGTVSI